MTLSNSEIVRLALTPGFAESIVKSALEGNNLGWYALGKSLKDSRDLFYTSLAITAIASGIGLSLENGSIRQYSCITVSTINAGISILAFKSLCKSAHLINSLRN